MRTKRRRGWVKAPPARKRASSANNKKALNQNEEAYSSFINQNNKEKSVSASSNDVELVDEDHSHSSSDSDESLSVEDSSSDDSAFVDRRSRKSTKGRDNGKQQASNLPKKQRIDDVKSSRVIKKVMKMDEAQPFNVPVDYALEKPEYRNVIDTPMDFGTICINLENSVKYMNSEDVFNDVQYIWENCCKCNKKGEYIVYLMKRVKKKFMKYWTAAGLCIEQSRKVNVGTSYEPSMTDYATRNSRHEPLTPVGLAVLGSSQISQDRLGYPPHQPLAPLAYSQGQPHQLQQSPPSTAWPQFSQFPPVSDRQFSQPLPLTNLPQFSQSQAGTGFNTAGTMIKDGGTKSNLGSRGEKKSRGGGNMCTSYQSTMDDTDVVTARRPSTTHPPPMLPSSIHPHIKQSSRAQLSAEPPLEASNSQATEDDDEIGGHNSTRSTRGLNRGINTPPNLADRKTIYIVDNRYHVKDYSL
ncbi:hypothetical protein CCACVL1_25011 [Corchorus capsularis]|uniref:Bromo domain-containing protein n=1 Tax=Corchorus capsularis TaxID=210143 RepID=A0A1R3GM97_COCAP|nr:hypothetical protein CCACVL1_25011 [Corchorus capsularis]